MGNEQELGEQEANIIVKKAFHRVYGDTDSLKCYSCGICTSSCPVSVVADGLDPRRIVQLENMGNLNVDTAGNSIWHCIECRRCGNLCPNGVKPWLLLKNLRHEAISEGRVPKNIEAELRMLRQEMVTVLDRIVIMPAPPDYEDLLRNWKEWANNIETGLDKKAIQPVRPGKRPLTAGLNNSMCLTCRECSSSCPICFNTDEFDPLYFIRSYNLGITPSKASIWSCIQCESCSRACTQSVQGNLVIKALQEEYEKFFDTSFQRSIRTAKENLFRAYISMVEKLLK